MVKNTKGGNKAKSQGRKYQNVQRVLNFEELRKVDDQEYARVTAVSGSGRYKLICLDKTERLGISRGKINRNEKIVLGSIVLISKRDFQDSKCDILHTYDRDEVNFLLDKGEFTSEFIQQSNNSSSDSNSITFQSDIQIDDTVDFNDL
jgi:translation initiation factor 1A